jgi:hypothetical protein
VGLWADRWGKRIPPSVSPSYREAHVAVIDQIAAVLPPRSVAGANDVNDRETLLYKKKGPTQGTDRMDATTWTSATQSASIFSKTIDGYAMQVVQGDHTNEYSKTTRMQVLVGSLTCMTRCS